MKFIQIFEIVDENANGEYDKGEDSKVPTTTDALPSMTWDFSETNVTDDGKTHFNITSQGGPYTIQFRNHLAEDTSLKFDVKITGYEFESEHENASLVLGFSLKAKRSGMQVQDRERENETKRVNFGRNAHFGANKSAQAQNGTIGVGVSNGESQGNQMAYIAYERFNGTLIHDPEIGLGGGVEANGISAYPILAIGVAMVISAVIAIRKIKNRK